MAISVRIMLALALLLASVGSAAAQENRVDPAKNGPAAPPQQQGPTDPTELETFLDDLLGREMKENHIAGAAVAVVKDGELFFAKGYGYADLEKKFPLTPNRRSSRLVQSPRCSPGQR